MEVASALFTVLVASAVLAVVRAMREFINDHAGINTHIEFEPNVHYLLADEVQKAEKDALLKAGCITRNEYLEMSGHSLATKAHPSRCVNCGAPLKSNKCEYCETVYD